MPEPGTKSCREHAWSLEDDGKNKCGNRPVYAKGDKDLDRIGDNDRVCCGPMPVAAPAAMPHRKSCRDNAWAAEDDGRSKCGTRSNPWPKGAMELDIIADD